MGKPKTSASGKTLLMGWSLVNSHVLCVSHFKTSPAVQKTHFRQPVEIQTKYVISGDVRQIHTCYHLRALKVLVRMDVAGCYSKVQSDKYE
jgi:hypothetical protein